MASILKQSRLDHAVEVLRGLGWVRASDFGWAMWGETTEAPDRGQGSHCQNKFCRSAGKLLREMKRRGLAVDRFANQRHEWRAVAGNREER